MQKEADYLYQRPDESNTDLPRECHILAMVHTHKGESIPNDVYNAVLGTVKVSRREKLGRIMDTINGFADINMGKEMSEVNKIVLAAGIASGQGVEGFEIFAAYDRRLKYLLQYFEGYLLTEDLGPTE